MSSPAGNLCGQAQADATAQGLALALPSLAVHANPTRGVVHVPAWLWATGYDEQPISTSRTYSITWATPAVIDPLTGLVVTPGTSGTNSFTVTVTFQPGRYTWSFGDGTSLDAGSLGQAYPTPSDVQHRYTTSSLGQPENLYTLDLTIDWVGSWQVSGDATGQGSLAPRTAGARTRYVVRDVESVRCPEAGCAP